MPARKPLSLNKGHLTVDEQIERSAAESMMTPGTPLSEQPPAELKRHQHATATWQRLLTLHHEIEKPIWTAFDQDALAKYCLLTEECIWLQGKRAEVDRNAVRLDKQIGKINPKGKEMLDIYYSLLEQYNALNTRVQGLDARLDGKRKLVHILAQSLYLTPRSRAGVAPAGKNNEKPDKFGKDFD